MRYREIGLLMLILDELNTYLGMIDVIMLLQRCERKLQQSFSNPLMSGPTITVTKINGGRASNMIPPECTVSIDMRVIPGMEPIEERNRLIHDLNRLNLNITHSDIQLAMQPLQTSENDPFCKHILKVCQHYSGQEIKLQGAPGGTDASWVPKGIPAVVLGPGNIEVAHSMNESIDIDQVVTCAKIYRDLMCYVPIC
jgi:acetylornithine deacetylase